MNEWDIVWRLGLALALSSAIGLEREMRQKAAGLRTNALVGVGSAAFWVSAADVTSSCPALEIPDG